MFRGYTHFPADFATQFLKNSENIEYLNMLLTTEAIVKYWNKPVYVTRDQMLFVAPLGKSVKC